MTIMSRRAVLLSGGGAVVLALLPVGALQNAFGGTMTSIPRRDAFTACRGTTFRISGNGLAVDAVLTEVDDLQPVLRVNDQKRFGLIFNLGAALPQGLYTFRQKQLGSVVMFGAPVDRGVKARCFQAVVNS
jgi:hypothetical protein